MGAESPVTGEASNDNRHRLIAWGRVSLSRQCRPIDKLLILNSIVFAFDQNRFSSVARGRLRPNLTLYCIKQCWTSQGVWLLNRKRRKTIHSPGAKELSLLHQQLVAVLMMTAPGPEIPSLLLTRQRNLRLAQKDEVRTHQPLSSGNKRTESNPSGLPRFSDLENVQPLSI